MSCKHTAYTWFMRPSIGVCSTVCHIQQQLYSSILACCYWFGIVFSSTSSSGVAKTDERLEPAGTRQFLQTNMRVIGADLSCFSAVASWGKATPWNMPQWLHETMLVASSQNDIREDTSSSFMEDRDGIFNASFGIAFSSLTPADPLLQQFPILLEGEECNYIKCDLAIMSTSLRRPSYVAKMSCLHSDYTTWFTHKFAHFQIYDVVNEPLQY